MAELHEGICGSHIGGRSLSSKAIRAGYYWPTMREDCTRYAQRCKKCQQHTDWHKAPPEELRSIYSPWPFLLRGLKRRLDKAKGTWAEEVPRIVWAYHTTPQSTTKETPFSLVYRSDAMIPREIQENSPCFQNFVVEESNEERKVNLDLLDEVREEARMKAKALKRRVEYKYNSKLRLWQFQVADLVMRKAHWYQLERKLSPKWTGPFRITKALGNGAYNLETLEGDVIPCTWNATNLKFYFS
ncbi:uncharacterized protein [Phaseolus vulgaris]|uniref:uncharacterized protein n=1 Tax=Phaseolus vulgaris TaxID=3885 RepID=UPI0035CAA2E9